MKWIAAHEFGHVFGLDDAYTLKNKFKPMSIMNDYWTHVQSIPLKESNITYMSNIGNTNSIAVHFYSVYSKLCFNYYEIGLIYLDSERLKDNYKKIENGWYYDYNRLI